MPRYFFHLYDDVVARDDEGLELSGAEAAREQAIASARAMACAEILDGHLNLLHRIVVVDEGGEVVATVHYRDAVDVES